VPSSKDECVGRKGRGVELVLRVGKGKQENTWRASHSSLALNWRMGEEKSWKDLGGQKGGGLGYT